MEAPGGRPRAPMVAKWMAPSQKAWVTVSLCARLLMAGFLAAFACCKYANRRRDSASSGLGGAGHDAAAGARRRIPPLPGQAQDRPTRRRSTPACSRHHRPWRLCSLLAAAAPLLLAVPQSRSLPVTSLISPTHLRRDGPWRRSLSPPAPARPTPQ